MVKQETENFTVRLTKQDRNYLDLLANLSNQSAGRYITVLLRREICRLTADIAKTIVTRTIAKNMGIPEKIVDTLESPDDIEKIMDTEKFRQFMDTYEELIINEVNSMVERYGSEEYAEE